MRALASPLAAFLLLALAAGGEGASSQAQDGVGAIVMVSGRDDHGLLQLAAVPLHPQPEATAISAHMPDGDFAEVLGLRGNWLHVRSVADPTLTGWIDDFRLRGSAVLHNVQQVRFLAARTDDRGGVEIEVQAVVGHGPAQWVTDWHLAEVGGDIPPHEH